MKPCVGGAMGIAGSLEGFNGCRKMCRLHVAHISLYKGPGCFRALVFVGVSVTQPILIEEEKELQD